MVAVKQMMCYDMHEQIQSLRESFDGDGRRGREGERERERETERKIERTPLPSFITQENQQLTRVASLERNEWGKQVR